MTNKDGIRTMGRSKEEDYFRKRDTEAIEKLRKEEARKADRAAMGSVIGSQNPKILAKLELLGFNHETVKLLHLIPLVQTAWADNQVDSNETALILDLSRERGIMPDSPSGRVLAEWLRKRPANKFFGDGLELISELLCSQTAEVRRDTAQIMVELCTRVAAASGGLFGWGNKTSGEERNVINRLSERIESPKESDVSFLS